MQTLSKSRPVVGTSRQSEAAREIVVRFINDIRSRFGVEVPAIAARTQPPMSPSTLYRWLDTAYEFNPSETKLRAIARAFGVAPPNLNDPDAPFALTDHAQEEMESGDHFEGVESGPNQGCWRIHSRALELAGLLPGDVVLADQTVTPVRGDIVVAQIVDLQTGIAKTRLRQYQPPYLMTMTMDAASFEQPQFVDNEKVTIWGTVVKTVRLRTG